MRVVIGSIVSMSAVFILKVLLALTNALERGSVEDIGTNLLCTLIAVGSIISVSGTKEHRTTTSLYSQIIKEK